MLTSAYINRASELKKKYDLVSAIKALPATQYRRDGYLVDSTPNGKDTAKKRYIYTKLNLTRSHITNLPGSSVFLLGLNSNVLDFSRGRK